MINPFNRDTTVPEVLDSLLEMVDDDPGSAWIRKLQAAERIDALQQWRCPDDE
jgi:hypothetical protein